MSLRVRSSSFFRRWAELVAPVRGWMAGGVTFRGGDERVNVLADDAELVGRGGVRKTENESVGSGVGFAWLVAPVGADSKIEKSASAHESIMGSFRVGA